MSNQVRTTTRPAGDTVHAERLLGDLDTLASFGGRPDGGVDRVAGSAADREARAWLARRIEHAGLHAYTDKIGNVFGRTHAGPGPWLLVGSHTDTVPAGGRLDGALGVLAALEALRTLHESGHPAADLIEIVSFWDEEGASPDSPGGLIGSTALCASEHIRQISGYLELHIEQGPRLENSGLELAAVDGIVGIDRYRIEVCGAANHAGTTPMDARSDAARGAARVLAGVRAVALGLDPGMVANVGCLELRPGSPNVIPGAATMVVEFRAGGEESLAGAGAELGALVTRIVGEERCTATIERISHKPVTRFDPHLCDLVEAACSRTSPLTVRLMSYAGHDASVLSGHVPTGMLFVPSTGGISHAPQESTPDRLLVQGCQALYNTIADHYHALS
ncbi:Zn-dependent hydrolase [Amycolatopsis sp. NPDC051758]|uniref:Zn-dependent hydrolase n=1 Tax=Amycolatopsis sp. NPDC051758 TaxID=3363935 RepID=UPI0037AA964F